MCYFIIQTNIEVFKSRIFEISTHEITLSILSPKNFLSFNQKFIDNHLNLIYFSTSCWAVVQLAGRRILAPLIKVRVLAAQPTHASPSSSRPRTTAFHAVDRGSNPLGDAKFGYKEECQGLKHLGILCFFLPVWFPEVQPCPLASKHFMGISVGRNVVRHF